jgi:hypothetical protein
LYHSPAAAAAAAGVQAHLSKKAYQKKQFTLQLCFEDMLSVQETNTKIGICAV